MKLQLNTAFSGKAKIELVKNDGSKREFLDDNKKIKNGSVIENDILDSFFTNVLTYIDVPKGAALRVGTGSSATVLSQTELDNFLAPTTGKNPTDNNPERTRTTESGNVLFSDKFTFLYDLGQIVGNVAEVGLFYGAYGTGFGNPANKEIHTRLLIKDEQGTPTAITVLADEQLKVEYTLTGTIPQAPTVQSTTYLKEGVVTNIDISIIWTGEGTLSSLFSNKFSDSSSSSSGDFYLTDQDVGGSGVNPSITKLNENKITALSDISDSVVSGERVKSISVGVSKCNFASGIIGMIPHSHSSFNSIYKWKFDPAIPKTNQQRLAFDVVTSYSRS